MGMNGKNRAALLRAEAARRQSDREKRMRNPSGGSAYAMKVRTRSALKLASADGERHAYEPRPLSAPPLLGPVGIHQPSVKTVTLASGRPVKVAFVDGDMKFL